MTNPASDARTRWFVLAAAFLGWMFDGLEMGIFPLVARPALQDLMHLQAADDALIGLWIGRITALFLIGAACGGLLFGWLGDRIGRVRSMTLSILTYSIFTGLCYLASEPWQFGAMRFVAALGMGGEWALGVALVVECWPEHLRPVLAGVIGAASNVGFASVGVAALIHPVQPDSWRWVMLAGAAPAVLTLFISLCVPESERWKESVKKRTVHPLREVLSPPLLKRTLFGITFAGVALIGTWGSVQTIPSWVDKLAHLQGQGGAAALQGADPKAVAQLICAIGAIVGCLIGPLVGAWTGRRMAYFGLCLLSLVLCGWLYRGFQEHSTLLLVVIGLVGATTAAFYGWLPLYLPELFPTRVRATGQGISFNAGRILAAVGALYAGSLTKFYGGDYARTGSMITLVYVVGMIVIWFAPETKGKPLPDDIAPEAGAQRTGAEHAASAERR
ncbi:MAG TPA: MFS transporter [Planctomycetota bacterium]|jgi:predicted MFS family arabinose efflux permease